MKKFKRCDKKNPLAWAWNALRMCKQGTWPVSHPKVQEAANAVGSEEAIRYLKYQPPQKKKKDLMRHGRRVPGCFGSNQ